MSLPFFLCGLLEEVRMTLEDKRVLLEVLDVGAIHFALRGVITHELEAHLNDELFEEFRVDGDTDVVDVDFLLPPIVEFV